MCFALMLATALLGRSAGADEEPAEGPASSEPPVTVAPPPAKPPRPEIPAEWSEPTAPPPQPVWRPNTPLVIGGVISFAVAYVPALGVGIASLGYSLRKGLWAGGGEHGADVLIVPLYGPFSFAARDPGDELLQPGGGPLSVEAKIFLYACGIVQVGGIGLIIAGLATGKETLPARAPPASARLVPLAAPGVAGISVAIDRW